MFLIGLFKHQLDSSASEALLALTKVNSIVTQYSSTPNTIYDSESFKKSQTSDILGKDSLQAKISPLLITTYLNFT